MELFDTQGLPAKSFQKQNSSQENFTGNSAKKCWNYFFLFHSDTKWQNVAPVGWFNLNKQTSLPCQSPDSKWQFLFGFNQKCQHFQCYISDSKVFRLRICLGWRWGWSVGHRSSVYFIDLFICLLLLVERSRRKRLWEKEDRHSLLPLPKLIGLGFVGVTAEVSHVQRSKGK